MDLRISKKTARVLIKAISFYIVGCFDEENKEFDFENLKTLGATPESLFELHKLKEKIEKQF